MTETKTQVLTDLTWSDLQENDVVYTVYGTAASGRSAGGEAWGVVRRLNGELYWLEEHGFKDQRLTMFHGFKITKVERQVPVVRPGKFGWATVRESRRFGFTFKGSVTEKVYFTFVDEDGKRQTSFEFENFFEKFEPQEVEK